MNKIFLLIILLIQSILLMAQDLTEGLIINDLSVYSMQDIEKPGYLNTIIDPTFGTTIRRISNGGDGSVIVPMYSTIQAWNADESFMILYNQSMGYHELLDGMTYAFIRILDDIKPADIEEIFWDFNNPDILYYLDNSSNDFIKYSVTNKVGETLVNLKIISGCEGGFSMGNDIQMMSWDSDVFTFRCENETVFSYRISTEELVNFDIEDPNYTAPAVAPSGNLYYHVSTVYDNMGNSTFDLNLSSVEHACIGKLENGHDAYYAIAFADGPQGGCLGDIIAHDLTTGACIPIISQDQGYEYPQSGTHISALAHKNTEGGWMAASMIGYDQDGQSLLDQELVIAKIENGETKVCRIGHHRSDEDQFDYWGEPHAVISPRGTRVLFGSDWSGEEDGKSVDSYVVELPAFSSEVSIVESNIGENTCQVIPNPVKGFAMIEFENYDNKRMLITMYDIHGNKCIQEEHYSSSCTMNTESLSAGLYFFTIVDNEGNLIQGKFMKQ